MRPCRIPARPLATWRLARGVARTGFACAAAVALLLSSPARAADSYQFHDAHFHLTNYVQEGIGVRDYLRIMGRRVGRSTLFGIPLQQQWSHRVSGDQAPTYYLDTDSPLYYYSFTDAAIAMAYRSLSPAEQARFDPMITGFNPADMYAADHIRRVLLTFPGVFSGIGEFTIHKEFVSSKVSGDVASLTDPALDRVLDFAAEAGLVVILHNDVDRPFAKEGVAPVFLGQIRALFARHPNTTLIWAHTGLGRVIQPVEDHVGMIESLIQDPANRNLYFDISWDEVAKYALSSPEAVRRTAELLNRHPDRFLFGTDTVAPASDKPYFAVFDLWKPVFDRLEPKARDQILKGNYERIFDEGRRKVRAWERAQVAQR